MSMKTVLLILILMLVTMPAQAFRLFRHKDQTPSQTIINEEILIEGKFANSSNSKINPTTVLDLRIAIHIPRDEQPLTITTLYDEINENPIEQITWVVDQGKKQKPIKIKAFKIDQIINQKIESIAMEYNPTLAYDRINDNKHIINKTFYYDKATIFKNTSNKPKLFLELYIPATKGLKTKSIRIDEQVYTSTLDSNLAPNKATINRPRIAPNTVPQTIPQSTEVDPDLEYAKQQLNNFNTNNQGTNNSSPNDQQLQQLQQLQQQMQVDSIDNEYGDFGEEEEDEEDSDF